MEVIQLKIETITPVRSIYAKERIVRPEEVIERVTLVTGVEYEQMQGPRGKNEIVRARQIAMTLIAHTCSHYTAGSIGRIFGGRDHTTVLHAKATVKNLVQTHDLYTRDLMIRLAPEIVEQWDLEAKPIFHKLAA